MGIKNYNKFIESCTGTRDSKISREQKFGNGTLRMAVDSNLVYYRLVGGTIGLRYQSDYDFVLRNLRVAYVDGRFRVYHEKKEHDMMVEAGMFENYKEDDPDLNEKMAKRVDYFAKQKLMNTASFIDEDLKSSYKPNMERLSPQYNTFSPDNQIYLFRKIVAQEDIMSLTPKTVTCPFTSGDGLVQTIMQENRYAGIIREFEHINLDLYKCLTMRDANNHEKIKEKYVEICCDDVVNDVPLFTSETEILIASVNEFVRYAEQLETQNIKPLFVWDQSVFGVSPAAGNCDFDFAGGSTKLRNTEKLFRSHCEPSRYIMFLTAVELIKRGYMVTVAVGEGELYCTHLQHKGVVDCIDSCDTDALAAGGTLYDSYSKSFINSYDSLAEYGVPKHIAKAMLQLVVPYCNGYDFQHSQMNGYSTTFLRKLLYCMINVDKILMDGAGITKVETQSETVSYTIQALKALGVPLKTTTQEHLDFLYSFYNLYEQGDAQELPVALQFSPCRFPGAWGYHYGSFDLYAFNMLREATKYKREELAKRVTFSLGFSTIMNLERQINLNRTSIKYGMVFSTAAVVKNMKMFNTPPILYRRSAITASAPNLKPTEPKMLFLPYADLLYKVHAHERGNLSFVKFLRKIFDKYNKIYHFDDAALFGSDEALQKFQEDCHRALGSASLLPRGITMPDQEPLTENHGYQTELGENWDYVSLQKTISYIPPYSSLTDKYRLMPRLPQLHEPVVYDRPLSAKKIYEIYSATGHEPPKQDEFEFDFML